MLLDGNGENDCGRNYGNGNPKTNSHYSTQNNGFQEHKNGFKKGSNTDNYDNGSRNNNKNDNYQGKGKGIGIGGNVKFASPYRSYGASDIVIKSSTYERTLSILHRIQWYTLFFFFCLFSILHVVTFFYLV